jgi:unsaturated chondroitin disaccharide hydrolase
MQARSVYGRSFLALLVACLCPFAVGPARAFDEVKADYGQRFAQHQLLRTAAGLSTSQSPKASRPDGTWTLVRADDAIAWTQGFFPGALWLMYERERNPDWRTRADAWTRPLEPQKNDRQTHDLGFKLMLSFGHAYRLTLDTYYRDVLLTAAGSLASRYNPTVGIIDCCDWNPAWDVPLVVDTMVNLELLFWGARNGGQSAWNDMALNHALRTLQDMVRPDGGTFHVVDYDGRGNIRSRGTFQGYADSSTWARGQAWAIYGFTMAYRYTRDARMLEAARRVTNYYLDRLPPDDVPNWDFDAPTQQKDSSTAAIVASALLELSTLVPEPTEQQRYRDAAHATLDSLSSARYLALGTASPGLLLHGVGHLPAGQEIDVSLIYGDYYFIEALRRFELAAAGGWYSSLVFAGSLHDLGRGNTGVREVEFDVTPLSHPIDGVIGYADSDTDVTGYSSLAMLIRMNPSGFFDVRRGDRYDALARVPYSAHTTYHVRMRTDLDARSYSVWVTPPEGAEILLADGFPFRSDAPPTDDLGKVSLKSGHFDNEFRVNNHTVRSESGAPPESPQEPEDSPPPFIGGRPLGWSCAAAPGSGVLGAGWLLWLLCARLRRSAGASTRP